MIYHMTFLRIILRLYVRSDILTNYFLRNSGTYGIDCRSFDILKNSMHDLTEPEGFFIALTKVLRVRRNGVIWGGNPCSRWLAKIWLVESNGNVLCLRVRGGAIAGNPASIIFNMFLKRFETFPGSTLPPKIFEGSTHSTVSPNNFPCSLPPRKPQQRKFRGKLQVSPPTATGVIFITGHRFTLFLHYSLTYVMHMTTWLTNMLLPEATQLDLDFCTYYKETEFHGGDGRRVSSFSGHCKLPCGQICTHSYGSCHSRIMVVCPLAHHPHSNPFPASVLLFSNFLLLSHGFQPVQAK